MADAVASEAGRALSRARWGDQRVRTLVDELVQRVAQVDEDQAARLRTVLDASRQQRMASR
jgi:hypothetical protein